MKQELDCNKKIEDEIGGLKSTERSTTEQVRFVAEIIPSA
jgi:hypothetical protein